MYKCTIFMNFLHFIGKILDSVIFIFHSSLDRYFSNFTRLYHVLNYFFLMKKFSYFVCSCIWENHNRRQSIIRLHMGLIQNIICFATFALKYGKITCCDSFSLVFLSKFSFYSSNLQCILNAFDLAIIFPTTILRRWSYVK